jgi:hypothetical protein
MVETSTKCSASADIRCRHSLPSLWLKAYQNTYSTADRPLIDQETRIGNPGVQNPAPINKIIGLKLQLQINVTIHNLRKEPTKRQYTILTSIKIRNRLVDVSC